jgi:hypothetical protein
MWVRLARWLDETAVVRRGGPAGTISANILGDGMIGVLRFGRRPRSEASRYRMASWHRFSEASWRSGDVADCKSAHPGSIPGEASKFLNKIRI